MLIPLRFSVYIHNDFTCKTINVHFYQVNSNRHITYANQQTHYDDIPSCISYMLYESHYEQPFLFSKKQYSQNMVKLANMIAFIAFIKKKKTTNEY